MNKIRYSNTLYVMFFIYRKSHGILLITTMEVKLHSIVKQTSDSVGKKVIPRNGTRECEESWTSEVPVFYRGKQE